jgi:hypothetical protein
MLFALAALAASAWPAELPGRYFQLIEAGSKQVEARLTGDPNVDLEKLEQTPGWKHFGYSVLGPAVLYAKQHPANPHYHDARMLVECPRINWTIKSVCIRVHPWLIPAYFSEIFSRL